MSSRLAGILGLPPVQPILPKRPETERPLMVVLVIMAFLATLALLAGRHGLRLGTEWQTELYGTASLQIFDVAPENRAIIIDRVTDRLANYSPIVTATPLSPADMIERLEPWLGTASRAEELPLPLFFALSSPEQVSATQIEYWLAPLELSALVDDHGQWRGEFETAGRALYRTAFLILGLVLTASAVIAGFATQSVMSAFAPTLSTLYRSGASRTFVAKLFIMRFFKLALVSAVIGVLAALFISFIWSGFVLTKGASLLQRLSLGPGDLFMALILILAFTFCCTLVAGLMAWKLPAPTGRK